MTPMEIAKVQSYLRRTFGSERIAIHPPAKPNAPVEIYDGEEFIGVLHRDEEDGDLSYNFSMAILDIDLD